MSSLRARPLRLVAWPSSHLSGFMDDVDDAWDLDDPLPTSDAACGAPWPR